MRSGITRRSAIKTAALATTALIAAPYVRGAHAAGKLSIGFWDHWVPDANKASEALTREWAEKEKVEVQIDYIPSTGDKNLITIAAEGQARSGHGFNLLPNNRKSFQHRRKIGRGNFDNIDGIERGARRGAFDRSEQSDLAEIIAAA